MRRSWSRRCCHSGFPAARCRTGITSPAPEACRLLRLATGNGGDSAGSLGTLGGSAGSAGTGANGGAQSTGGVSVGGLGAVGGGDMGGEHGLAGAGSEPDCVPTPEVCDGVSNDCDDEVDEDGVCPDGCAAQTFENHANDSAWVNYTLATTRCADLRATLGLGLDFELAWVESANENSFLKDWIAATSPATGMVWMGANDIDKEGQWVWGRGADAERFFDGATTGGGTAYQGRFNDFGEGRPNSSNNTDEDCGAFDSAVNWQWNDLKCSDGRLGYLCEETP